MNTMKFHVHTNITKLIQSEKPIQELQPNGTIQVTLLETPNEKKSTTRIVTLTLRDDTTNETVTALKIELTNNTWAKDFCEMVTDVFITGFKKAQAFDKLAPLSLFEYIHSNMFNISDHDREYLSFIDTTAFLATLMEIDKQRVMTFTKKHNLKQLIQY